MIHLFKNVIPNKWYLLTICFRQYFYCSYILVVYECIVAVIRVTWKVQQSIIATILFIPFFFFIFSTSTIFIEEIWRNENCISFNENAMGVLWIYFQQILSLVSCLKVEQWKMFLGFNHKTKLRILWRSVYRNGMWSHKSILKFTIWNNVTR